MKKINNTNRKEQLMQAMLGNKPRNTDQCQKDQLKFIAAVIP